MRHIYTKNIAQISYRKIASAPADATMKLSAAKCEKQIRSLAYQGKHKELRALLYRLDSRIKGREINREAPFKPGDFPKDKFKGMTILEVLPRVFKAANKQLKEGMIEPDKFIIKTLNWLRCMAILGAPHQDVTESLVAILNSLESPMDKFRFCIEISNSEHEALIRGLAITGQHQELDYVLAQAKYKQVDPSAIFPIGAYESQGFAELTPALAVIKCISDTDVKGCTTHPSGLLTYHPNKNIIATMRHLGECIHLLKQSDTACQKLGFITAEDAVGTIEIGPEKAAFMQALFPNKQVENTVRAVYCEKTSFTNTNPALYPQLPDLLHRLNSASQDKNPIHISILGPGGMRGASHFHSPQLEAARGPNTHVTLVDSDKRIKLIRPASAKERQEIYPKMGAKWAKAAEDTAIVREHLSLQKWIKNILVTKQYPQILVATNALYLCLYDTHLSGPKEYLETSRQAGELINKIVQQGGKVVLGSRDLDYLSANLKSEKGVNIMTRWQITEEAPGPGAHVQSESLFVITAPKAQAKR